MIYIIDTYAWIEYFKGSKQGLTLKKLLSTKNTKFVTMECCVAELIGFCLKNKIDFADMYRVVKRNSFIFPVLITHWINAAKIRYELRESIKNFGLVDSILVAKQKELKCKIISGDPHFKNLTDVVFIGKK